MKDQIIIAYQLLISELEDPKLFTRKIEFVRCLSGQLRFQHYKMGVQYVPKRKWNTLEVFDQDQINWIICDEGKFSEEEIKAKLMKFHKKEMMAEMKRLKIMIEKLK